MSKLKISYFHAKRRFTIIVSDNYHKNSNKTLTNTNFSTSCTCFSNRHKSPEVKVTMSRL